MRTKIRNPKIRRIFLYCHYLIRDLGFREFLAHLLSSSTHFILSKSVNHNHISSLISISVSWLSMPPTLLRFTMNPILVLLLLFHFTNGQEKFCPTRDPNNPRCLSSTSQYKCGVFFVDLPGKTNQLGWLGALPDVFRKPSVKASLEVKASLAGASPESFNLTDEQCEGVDKLANSRCFTIMTKLRSTPFTNCTKNVLNDGGIDTFGNILCGKMAKFYQGNLPYEEINKAGGIRIGFYHSGCGSEWTPTGNPAGPLRAPRPLCCIQDESTGRYLQVRCRGTPKPIYSCTENQ